MGSFPQIKHDSDGKIFYEDSGVVHWVVEVPIYVGDNVALAFNRIIKLVEEKFTSTNKQNVPCDNREDIYT